MSIWLSFATQEGFCRCILKRNPIYRANQNTFRQKMVSFGLSVAMKGFKLQKLIGKTDDIHHLTVKNILQVIIMLYNFYKDLAENS